ncbi:hypothetical protein [Nocardia spumae]|uniref:hypothetical protein n=1 Tax=Nocardia spumae TaxID=2887190 RepID=UPI001D14BF0C|nr:hypothetical protein [Nocardia spumae]
MPAGNEDVARDAAALAVLDIDLVAPLRIEATALMALVPEVVVDGRLIARGWGHWAVPVPAGRHEVRIHVNRFGALLHPARLAVETGPGERTPVYYRMPISAFASARIGTTPQRAGGGAALAAVILLAVLAVPLAVSLLAVFALLLF